MASLKSAIRFFLIASMAFSMLIGVANSDQGCALTLGSCAGSALNCYNNAIECNRRICASDPAYGGQLLCRNTVRPECIGQLYYASNWNTVASSFTVIPEYREGICTGSGTGVQIGATTMDEGESPGKIHPSPQIPIGRTCTSQEAVMACQQLTNGVAYCVGNAQAPCSCDTVNNPGTDCRFKYCRSNPFPYGVPNLKCSTFDNFPNWCNSIGCSWSLAGGGGCHPTVNESCTYSPTSQIGNCCPNSFDSRFCVNAPNEGSALCGSCIPAGTPIQNNYGDPVYPTRCLQTEDCCNYATNTNISCDQGASSVSYLRCVKCLPANGRTCSSEKPCCPGLRCDINDNGGTCKANSPPYQPSQPNIIPYPSAVQTSNIRCAPYPCSTRIMPYPADPDGDLVAMQFKFSVGGTTLDWSYADNFVCNGCLPGTQVKVQARLVESVSGLAGPASAWSPPTTIITPPNYTCTQNVTQVCGENGCCLNGLFCKYPTNVSLAGTCCIPTNSTIWTCTSSNQCCSGKCEFDDSYPPVGRCTSGWSCGHSCANSSECASECPTCAAEPGSSSKYCRACIPINSSTSCASNTQCCSRNGTAPGLCNQLAGSPTYHTCVNCLPLNHTCSINADCCSNLCQDLGGVSDLDGGSHSTKICAPPPPPCSQQGRDCKEPELPCCRGNYDPPLFCDYLNPNSAGIGVPIGSQQNAPIAPEQFGACHNCYPNLMKCDPNNATRTCCGASAGYTCRLPAGSTQYRCLPAPAAEPRYLFQNWAEVGQGGRFVPETSNVHTGEGSATALKISGDPNAYIYNTVLVLRNNTGYSIDFWAASESGGSVRYAVYDVSNDAYLTQSGLWVPATGGSLETNDPVIIDTGINTAEYQHFVRNFRTISSGVGYVQLRLYPPASGAAAYVDDLDVKEISDFTMIAWVKTTGNADNAKVFQQLAASYGGQQGISWFFTGTNTLHMEIYSATNSTSPGATASVAPTVTIPDAGWHMVALSASRLGNYTAYLDGVRVSTGRFSLGSISAASPLFIGANDSYGHNPFSGQLDEIRFYKRALSDSEILSHYNGKYQGSCTLDVKTTYLTPSMPGSLRATYGANLRIRALPSETILSMPFDSNVSTNATGAVTDYSGSLSDGTKTGAEWTASGKVGGAYMFSSVNDKIQLSAPLLSGTGDFTLSAWVKSTDPASANYIMGNYGLGNGGGVEFYVYNGVLYVYINGYVSTPTKVPANTWTHVAAVRKAGQITLYINGVASASGSLPSSITANRNFAIGNGPDYTSERFKGTIDEVRVFSRALTDKEVASLYSDNGLLTNSALIASQN